jgi:putative tricarboxylic transport membrane protein
MGDVNHDTSNAAGPPWKVLAAVGVALLALAALVYVNSRDLSAPAIAGVGPAAAQLLVAGLLALLGVVHLIQAYRQYVPVQAEIMPANSNVNTTGVLWILGGLMALMICVATGAGFVLGASSLFVATARAFGQPIGIKSTAIAFSLTLPVYLVFTKGLGLSLPTGLLERLLTV